MHLIRLVAVASIVAVVACSSRSGGNRDGLPPIASSDGYRLVWSDEFDGSGALDSTKWGYESGFVRNQELQWYQPENAVRSNGMLVIEGRRERKPNPRYVAPAALEGAPAGRRAWANREMIEYTSSSVNTRGKHAWLYGRFEIRARIDVRLGSWPAFWTLGTQGPWPANGEVDIMEFYHDTLLFNVAWGGANGAMWNTVTKRIDQMPAGWADNFHVWRMDWDATAIRLYLDDVLMNTQSLATTINSVRAGASGNNPPLANPFHGPAYLLVNQAIGGAHGGDPTETRFPVRYEVDYVRVYQKR